MGDILTWNVIRSHDDAISDRTIIPSDFVLNWTAAIFVGKWRSVGIELHNISAIATSWQIEGGKVVRALTESCSSLDAPISIVRTRQRQRMNSHACIPL